MKKHSGFRLIPILAALGAWSGATSAAVPAGWMVAGDAPKDYEYGTQKAGSSDGSTAAFIKARSDRSSGFGTLMQTISADEYRGQRLRLSALLRSDAVGRGQMWMRIDGPDRKVLGFDNMDSRPITGTAGWQRYHVVLDVPRDATAVAFGFFLSGKGTLWADGFRLEIVDRSVPLTAGTTATGRRPRNLGFED